MKFERCSICNCLHWNDEKCKPVFRVYLAEEGFDSVVTVRADTHAHAAEQWAENFDNDTADYSIVGQRFQPALNVIDEFGEERSFVVNGEAVPTYYAKEVK